MFAWLAACVPPPASVSGPALVQPSSRVPFARRIDWKLDRDVTVELEATDGTHEIALREGPGRAFSLPLVGLYADAGWTVRLTATDAHGGVLHADPLSFRTTPLPTPFPRLELRVNEPDEAGATLIPLTGVAGIAPSASWLVEVDGEGEVQWLFDGGLSPIYEAHPVSSPDGSGVRMMVGDVLEEIDWLGDVDRRLRPAVIARWDRDEATTVPGAQLFTHELTETDDGDWVTIDKEVRQVADFPVSYSDPGDTASSPVAGDDVVQIDPDTAEIVRRWSLSDHLDPHRIGYNSLDEFDDGLIATLADHVPDGADWTHANAVSIRGGEMLVSARHQDALFLVDPGGTIEFVLGNPDNWGPAFRPLLLTPVGQPFAWSYHQHGVKWLDGDRVLLFDNGNYRASPWTSEVPVANEDNRSRIVEYQVDRQARTVSQLWSFELDPPVFSLAMGDADPLPNGHVLGTWSYVTFEGGRSNEDLGRGTPETRVVEFDPATGRIAWDLEAWAPSGSEPAEGWYAYRAERFPGFY